MKPTVPQGWAEAGQNLIGCRPAPLLEAKHALLVTYAF